MTSPAKKFNNFHYDVSKHGSNAQGEWTMFAPVVRREELLPEPCEPTYIGKLVPMFKRGVDVPRVWLSAMKVALQDNIRCRRVVSPTACVMFYTSHMPGEVEWYEPLVSAWCAEGDPVRTFLIAYIQFYCPDVTANDTYVQFSMLMSPFAPRFANFTELHEWLLKVQGAA